MKLKIRKRTKGAFINYVTQQREIVLVGTFKCKRDRDWETALRNL